MTVCIENLLNYLHSDSPFSLAESWDNVGLLIGDRNQQVRSILIGLDPSNRLIDEAIALGADTVITHHPIIFKPLAHIDTAAPAGRLLAKILAHNIAVIACHTNLDSAEYGVSDALASALGLDELRPLVPAGGQYGAKAGLGCLGSYIRPLDVEEFFSRVLTVLELSAIQVAGPEPSSIQRVALCGGSGSELAERAFAAGADVYLSAEIKHSTARWAEEHTFCILDGTHYATEKLAVKLLADKISTACSLHGWNIEVHCTASEKPPMILRGSNRR